MSPMPSRRTFMQQAALSAGVMALGTQVAGRVAAEETPAVKRLKKAVQWNNLPEAGSDEAKIKLAKDCGFDGIEIPPMADLDQAKRLGELGQQIGCRIHSVIYGGWGAPMSDPKPEVIAKGHAEIENALRTAKAAGADNILLVPAVVTERVSYGMAMENSKKNIPPMIPLAEELGIIIAIEEVWNKFLLSPLEFAQYIDDFNSPWIKAYFDVGNVVIYGYPQDWIRTLGKRIYKMHWKDFKRAGFEWPALPYEGDVDWREVRKAIDEVGYDGWFTEEFPKGDEAWLREMSRRLDCANDGKRRCGEG